MNAPAPTAAVTPQAKPTWRRRVWRFCWRLVAAFVCISVLLVALFRFLPVPVSALMIERKVSALIEGTDTRRWRYDWQSWQQIAPAMPVALMAGEDQRFPQHAGFDWQQMEKAWQAHQRGKRLRGASTLSQQVAKNLFLWSGRSYLRKGLEAWFTVLIELLWSKQRILEVHMNIVEFGTGIYGVEAASRHFFQRPAARLTREQAALLVAVLPNPHRFRVDKPSAYVLKRQRWILGQMRQLGDRSLLKTLD